MKKIHNGKDIGLISIILALISLFFFPFIFIFHIQFQTIHVHLIVLGLAILSIGLGLISYHSEKKISWGFYGLIIGIIAFVIIIFIFLIGIIWFITRCF